MFKIFSKSNIQVSLNSWNTKYSQNVTCVYKNILSIKHILFESPATTELFQKYGYDNGYMPVCLSVMSIFMGLSVMSLGSVCLYGYDASNKVRYILYNTDVIIYVVKLIVRSPVGKLVQYTKTMLCVCCVCVRACVRACVCVCVLIG